MRNALKSVLKRGSSHGRQQFRPYNSNNDPDYVVLSKASVGFSAAGWAFGQILIGPVTGTAMAAGAFYLTQRQGEVGEISRRIGKLVYRKGDEFIDWARYQMNGFRR